MVRVVKNYETRRAVQIRKNYASVSFDIAGPQRARSPATPFKTNKLFFLRQEVARKGKRGNLERATFTSDLQPGTQTFTAASNGFF